MFKFRFKRKLYAQKYNNKIPYSGFFINVRRRFFTTKKQRTAQSLMMISKKTNDAITVAAYILQASSWVRISRWGFLSHLYFVSMNMFIPGIQKRPPKILEINYRKSMQKKSKPKNLP